MIVRRQQGKPVGHGIVVAVLLGFVGLLIVGDGNVMAEGGGAEGASSSGLPGVAQKEVIRRQSRVRQAQELIRQADFEYREKNYKEALSLYVSAFQGLDQSPASASLRLGVFQRYQTAVVKYARQLIDEGHFADAERLLVQAMKSAKDSGLSASLISPDLRKLLGQVRDNEHYNKARTPLHIKNVAEVEFLLKKAQGAADLGRFDEATKVYGQVLAIDSYNEAARRGMEHVDRLVTEYYKSARNQARADSLMQVAKAWELPVPHKMDLSNLIENPDGISAGDQAAAIQEKLVKIVIPNIEFQGARLIDVMMYLVQKSQELDVEESNPAKKGVNVVIDPGGGPAVNDQPVNIKLSNVPLGEVLRYVSAMVGLKPKVEPYAVRLVPLSNTEDTAMVTRRYQVPPGFIRGGGGGGADAGGADPFAEPAAGGGGTLVRRVTAKDFLLQRGVLFPAGALAQFIPATSTLLVRNTPDNIQIIESMVISSRGEGAKIIKIDFKMITIAENKLNELGFDWLLGASNLLGSNRTFISGGTAGNSNPIPSTEYPFVAPGTTFPVGRNPVSAGIRSGNVRTTLSIDDILEANTPSVTGTSITNSPGVFAVGGVFTDPQFQVVIRALNQQKGADRVCEASVITRSGDKAVIKQVREFIYPTEYDPPEIPNSTGGVIFINLVTGETRQPDGFAVTPANPTAFEMRELGKILEVTPTLGGDNTTVGLEIVADVSDFIGFINYGSPILNGGVVATSNRIVMPVFEAVKETTNVTIWDGQTVAIGGLIGEVLNDAEDQIPLLGDLPGIGRLFRSKISQRSKKAMVMFVTVRVLDPSGAPVNKAVVSSE
ncbi:MAG: type II and III secretion system protein [Verrucomicrobia bacterium]|nr:type II and III secretion system protein [Verrucomicrobiota bacterium]